MRCTVLADGVAVGVVTLTFQLAQRGSPATVLASGPIEPLAAFEAHLGPFVPPPARPLVPFHVGHRPSPPLWTPPLLPWPSLALQDARGARLPTRTVHCLPTRQSPSGLVVAATFDEAAAPVGARVLNPLDAPGAHHDLPEADV